jgi:hypothetical protein
MNTRFFIPLSVLMVFLAACGPSQETISTQTAAAATMTAASWTETPTQTSTPTEIPTSTSTPTRTPTDTPTATPSQTPSGPSEVVAVLPNTIPCKEWSGYGSCKWDFTVTFVEKNGVPATIERIGRLFKTKNGRKYTIGTKEWHNQTILIPGGGSSKYSSWVRTTPDDDPDLRAGTVVVSYSGVDANGYKFSGSTQAKLASSPTTADPLVRMMDKAEAQRVFAEQNIEFLARKAVEEYSSEELDRVSQSGGNLNYTIYLNQSEPIAWGTGWCTTTEAILYENFDHRQYKFILNGKEVPLDQFVEIEYNTEDGQSYCRQIYTILTDWTPGESIIKTVITLDQPINDGWDDYAAGVRTYEYRVILTP